MNTMKNVLKRLKEQSLELEKAREKYQTECDQRKSSLMRKEEALEKVSERLKVIVGYENSGQAHMFSEKEQLDLRERSQQLSNSIRTDKWPYDRSRQNFLQAERELKYVRGLLLAESHKEECKALVIKLKREFEEAGDMFAKRQSQLDSAIDKLPLLKQQREKLVQEAIQEEIDSGVVSADISKRSRELLDDIELQGKRVVAFEMARDEAQTLSNQVNEAYQSAKKSYFTARAKEAELKCIAAAELFMPSLVELRAAERLSGYKGKELSLIESTECVKEFVGQIVAESSDWM